MSLFLAMSYDPNPNYELYAKAATLARTLNWAFDSSICVYPPDKHHPEMYKIHFNWNSHANYNNIEAYGILILLEEAGIPLEERADGISVFHKDYIDLLLTYIKTRGYKIYDVFINSKGEVRYGN